MKCFGTDGFSSSLSRMVILVLHLTFDSTCLAVGKEVFSRGEEKYLLLFSDIGK